jgi:hypothetical protein
MLIKFFSKAEDGVQDEDLAEVRRQAGDQPRRAGMLGMSTNGFSKGIALHQYGLPFSRSNNSAIFWENFERPYGARILQAMRQVGSRSGAQRRECQDR